jgi:hypothetical protein
VCWQDPGKSGVNTPAEKQGVLEAEPIIHNWWLTLSLARWHDRFASMLLMVGIT